MKKFSCSAKKVSICKVFDILCHNSNLSNKDISLMTGLSSVTTAKIINAFHSSGIFKLNHEKAKFSGVRSTVYSLNRAFYFMIFDLSSPEFKMQIYDIKFKLKLSYTFSNNDLLQIDENFNQFLLIIKQKLKYLDKNKCIGTAIIFPGIYNDDDNSCNFEYFSRLKGIGIKNIVDNLLFSENRIFISKIEAASGAVSMLLNQAESALLLSFYGNIPHSITIHSNYNKTITRDLNISDSKLTPNLTMEEYLIYQNNRSKLSEKLNTIITQLSSFIKLDRIYLSFDNDEYCNYIVRLIHNINPKLSDHVISLSTEMISQCFIAPELRKIWLNSIINS